MPYGLSVSARTPAGQWSIPSLWGVIWGVTSRRERRIIIISTISIPITIFIVIVIIITICIIRSHVGSSLRSRRLGLFPLAVGCFLIPITMSGWHRGQWIGNPWSSNRPGQWWSHQSRVDTVEDSNGRVVFPPEQVGFRHESGHPEPGEDPYMYTNMSSHRAWRQRDVASSTRAAPN